MPCYSPLEAWKPLAGGSLLWCERGDARAILIPCGQCTGCRLERSRQWATRCLHESQLHDKNCYLTLTYNDDNLPANGSLRYRDFQLFLKRLRKAVGPIRFYMCGEYGELHFRPHFHALVFGYDFPDRVYFGESPAGFPLYISAALSELWSFGHCSVGDVTFESAAYVARYVMKKVTGPRAAAHYERLDVETGEIYSLVPEFTRMSLKPGIGLRWIRKFRSDVYPRDYVVVRGVKCRPPRYYDNFISAEDNWRMKYVGSVDVDTIEMLKFEREFKASKFADDGTPERLRVKETVAKAGLNFKKRSL